jgi:putative cell wall-binding protein
MSRRLVGLLALTLLAALVPAMSAISHEREISPARVSALAQMEDPGLTASDNMRHVANIPYELRYDEPIPHGTDIEFYSVDLGPEPGTTPGAPDAPDAPPTVPGADDMVERLGSESREGSAVAVSQQRFETAEEVVLARVDDYADALAGSSLAADRGAPLLLSAPDALSDETAAEIERLGATRATLLGRTAALDEQVAADLEAMDVETSRIGGPNRWATAAMVMDALPATDEVLLVEGDNADPQRGWPDALSAATLGAFESRPILLAPEFELPTETEAQLSDTLDVTILGGTAAISDEVAADVDAAAGEVARIAGADRYGTNAMAAREAIARGADPATTYVASGDLYTDGLVAGAAAGGAGGLLVLVDGKDLDNSPETTDLLTEQADAIAALFIVGGTDVVTPESEARLRELVGGDEAQEDGSAGSDGSDGTPVDNNDPEGAEVPDGAEGEVDERRFGERDFAVAGSYDNGMQIIDITDPEAPEIASVYDCGVLQGDVQIFERDGRTYATYTSENTSRIVIESRCVQDAVDRGDVVFEDANGNGEIAGSEKSPSYGTYIADITDPYAPTSAGFIPVIEGSHNGSVHPSGEYFYNSDSALINDVTPQIQVYDIRDFDRIERVATVDLIPLPGLGTSSHDITFNADGTRGYSAALSQNVILDTTDPASPVMLTTFSDPAIETEHQSNVMTLTDSEGAEREILVSEDELIGAIEGNTCPGGGVHFYDITGEKAADPLGNKIGAFFIPEMRLVGPAVPLTGIDLIEDEFGESGTCTAHVFALYPEQGLMTIAWYNAGTRVVDISALADAGTNPAAMPVRECGFAYFENSDTWSAKTNRIDEDGSFYLYANDIIRGLDVFEYTPDACQAQEAENGSTSRFVSPEEALRIAQARTWPGTDG